MLSPKARGLQSSSYRAIPPGMNGARAFDDGTAGSLGSQPAGCDRALGIPCHSQHGVGRQDTGISHRLAPILVVQIEPQHGFVPITDGLEGTTLGGRQVESIAIDVDSLGVAPHIELGAIRVEHGNHQEGQILQNGLGPRFVGMAQ